MNRRVFIQRSGLIAVLAAAPMALATGCSVSIVNILNTVIDSTEKIIEVAEPSAPWLASLKSALTALTAAEAGWVNGGPIADVETVLNTLADVLSAIPLTAVYSPLIDLLVAAIDAVLNATKSTGGKVGALAPNARTGRAKLKAPHILQTQVGAYKAQWNETAVKLGLNQAKLK